MFISADNNQAYQEVAFAAGPRHATAGSGVEVGSSLFKYQ
jgi:FtsZ-interacting cell division protein YlmF